MIGNETKAPKHFNAKGEIKVKEKHTNVMYIIKLNNVPSEGCDTSQSSHWKK